MGKHSPLKLLLVALVAICLAVFSFATIPDTTPAPDPEIQADMSRPTQKPRQPAHRQRQATASTDDGKREAALMLLVRCTLEREAAKERYAELTEVSDIDSIDTKAAVEAWRAWSEVETRCADVSKMPRLAERDGAPNNPN